MSNRDHHCDVARTEACSNRPDTASNKHNRRESGGLRDARGGTCEAQDCAQPVGAAQRLAGLFRGETRCQVRVSCPDQVGSVSIFILIYRNSPAL